MLTCREAAAILGVTETTAQRLRDAGALGDMSRAAVEAIAAKRADKPLSYRAAAAILGCSHENVRLLYVGGALPDLKRATVEALKAGGYAPTKHVPGHAKPVYLSGALFAHSVSAAARLLGYANSAPLHNNGWLAQDGDGYALVNLPPRLMERARGRR